MRCNIYLILKLMYISKKYICPKPKTSSLCTTVLSYNGLPESQNNGNPDLFKYLNRTVL